MRWHCCPGKGSASTAQPSCAVWLGHQAPAAWLERLWPLK